MHRCTGVSILLLNFTLYLAILIVQVFEDMPRVEIPYLRQIFVICNKFFTHQDYQHPYSIPLYQEWLYKSVQANLQLFAVVGMIIIPSFSICLRKKERI